MAKILVVDDESDNREALAATLEADGHEVLLAANGIECLEQVSLARPDVILLDMEMPFMNGLETLGRLKADAGTAAIPVIMVTAVAKGPLLLRAADAGVCDYVTKPWDPGEVDSAVRSALEWAAALGPVALAA